MTFTYTDVLGGASPLRGGRYAGMAILNVGQTTAAVDNLVSTTLASVIFVTLNIYGQNQTSNFVKSVSTNGMLTLDIGGACSGNLIVIGN